MEIKGKKVMVLGGAGLVGKAIGRFVLAEHPKYLAILSLKRPRERKTVNDLKKEFPQEKIFVEWCDLFASKEFKNIIEPLNDKILKASPLYNLILKYEPEIIIDAINTATNIAYRDLYQSAKNLYEIAKLLETSQKPQKRSLKSTIENHLQSLDIPYLVRHIQILYEAIRKNPKKEKYKLGAEIYIKVGTSGFGGMGLNIPYTHGEEHPSSKLLSKASVAGAHSALLFLMARTPDAPTIKEIKPVTAIAWGEVGYGKILVNNKPIQIVDCTPENSYKLKGTLDIKNSHKVRVKKGSYLKSVFIDNGESGLYALEEFKALTSLKQMEYITPEEVAENVINEIKGFNTGKDVLASLDSSVMGPSYRAGILRSAVISHMETLEDKKKAVSVAFETLGPPRTSKLLFEAYLFSKTFRTLKNAAATPPQVACHKLASLIKRRQKIRSRILSIGIPILLPDGISLLRGNLIKVPSEEEQPARVSQTKINSWAKNGWVDLRKDNIILWQERFKRLMIKINQQKNAKDSSFTDKTFLKKDSWKPDYTIDVGETVGYILNEEERGWRVKE